MKKLSSLLLLILLVAGTTNATAQTVSVKTSSLNQKQQSLVAISALAGKGELKPLHIAIGEGLNAGWTINELKEAMVQVYAYAGFPRSLNGLSTLKAVVDERKQKGINDIIGREPSPLPTDNSKLEAGTGLQTKLLGISMRTSIAEFAPIIDVFLKEHLFWDVFGRDNLDFQTRELITISTLAGLGNAEAQLQSHIGVSMYNGITEAQLNDWVTIVQTKVGRKETKSAGELVQAVVAQRQNNSTSGKTITTRSKLTAPAKNDMMIRISEIEIHAKDLAAYKDILKEEAAASVQLEPGVISIFPMYQKNDSTQIRILEIYADRQAYESHLKTEHFQKYKTSTLSMVKSLRLIDMHAIDTETMKKLFTKLHD